MRDRGSRHLSRLSRVCLAASAVLAALLAAGPSAQASTTIGQTGSGFNCSGAYTYVQASTAGPPSYVAPTSGVITSWSTLASGNAGQSMALKVLRRDPSNTAKYFTLAKDISRPLATLALNSFPTTSSPAPVRIRIQAGDVIGVTGSTLASCSFTTGTAGDGVSNTTFVGEIVIRGHNVFAGYLDDPEATATAIVDGWFRTGDIGTVDKDGFISIVDRKKDLIIRGGFNVYPREVEEVLARHPSVAQVAVIGVPDDEKGEEICAVVIAAPSESGPPDPAELIAWSREHLGRHKYPRRVEVLDALPMGPSHKVLKRELRTRFSGPLPGPVDPQEGTA